MEINKRVYNLSDMVDQDLDKAPSLDLPALKIEKFYTPRDKGKYMLFLANIAENSISRNCPYCGCFNSLNAMGRGKPRLIHDVVRNNHRVDIIFQPQRMQCKECGQHFTMDVEGISQKRSMTERLLEYLRVECFLQPLSALAERSGISIETVRNILLEESAKYEKYREEHPLNAPRVLGIDEKHIIDNMRGTIVDVEKGELLDMMDGNKEADMKAAIQKLVGWDTNIEVVTTDMNNSYIMWLPSFLPNAKVVIDKFHVIQDIQQRINKTKKGLYAYRKKLIEQVEDLDEKERQLEILHIVKDNKRLFNYSAERLSRDEKNKAQKLTTVIDEFPEFLILRRIYDYVEEMYTKETRAEAEAVWDKWVDLLPPSGNVQYNKWCSDNNIDTSLFEEYRSFSRRGFQSFKPYILNYFDPGCRHTNAATEGINNLIGTINSSGSGYSFEILRAKCLFASLIHEKVLYSFDMKCIRNWVPTISMSFRMGGGSGRYETIEKYEFNQQKSNVNIPAPNVLTDNEQLLASLFEPEQERFVGVAEDDVIESAWKIFQPNAAARWSEKYDEEHFNNTEEDE